MTHVTIETALLEQLVGALEGVQLCIPPAQRPMVLEAITAGRAAIANAEPTGWQPIETAPNDFVTLFDGWNGERVPNVSWAHPKYSSKGNYAWCVSEYEHHNGWVNTEVEGLTHWMPLPAAPQGGTK